MKKIIFYCVIVLIPVHALSQDAVPTYSIGVFYDQDHTLEILGLDKLNEDRNYTLGFGLYFQSTNLGKCFFFAPNKLMNRLFNHQDKFRRGVTREEQPVYSLLFGGSGFTPDSLSPSYVIYNDRPYSSIIRLQTSINNPEFARYYNYRSTFTIGWLGSSLPGDIQTAIHVAMNENNTKPPWTPKGWHNQVSDGGEPTIGYTYTKEKLLTRKHLDSGTPEHSYGGEFKHGYTYSLGYHTWLGYELGMRLGRFDAYNWIYNASPLSGGNKDNRVSTNRRKAFEIYMLTSVRPMFLLYNAMLNGQFKKSPHTVNFNDTRHLLLEFDAGIGLSFPTGAHSGIDLMLNGSGRSPEFKLPRRDTRFHFWAGARVIYSHF